MLEEEIKRKRKELDESIRKNENYSDVYRLSIELDDLISEFYKKTKEKNKTKRTLTKQKQINKILFIA